MSSGYFIAVVRDGIIKSVRAVPPPPWCRQLRAENWQAGRMHGQPSQHGTLSSSAMRPAWSVFTYKRTKAPSVKRSIYRLLQHVPDVQHDHELVERLGISVAVHWAQVVRVHPIAV